MCVDPTDPTTSAQQNEIIKQESKQVEVILIVMIVINIKNMVQEDEIK